MRTSSRAKHRNSTVSEALHAEEMHCVVLGEVVLEKAWAAREAARKKEEDEAKRVREGQR